MTANSPTETAIYSIIEQAVTDVKELRKHGVLIGRRIMTLAEWPTDQGQQKAQKRFCGWYDSPAKVRELLAFFTAGGMARILSVVGSCIRPEDAAQALGLAGWEEEAGRES